MPPTGRIGATSSWKSRLAWAGRPHWSRRPSQARRLDRADVRSSSWSVVPLVDRGAVGGVRSFGILSTFPPTACGIATFSAALAAGLVAHGAAVDVVRCGEDEEIEDPLVVASMGAGGPDGSLAAADALNGVDVAIVQHEYGIYGGRDGDDVLDVLDALSVPSIVVAHTVVRHPTAHQRFVLEARVRRGRRRRRDDRARPAAPDRGLRCRRRPGLGHPPWRDDATERCGWDRSSDVHRATGCAS